MRDKSAAIVVIGNEILSGKVVDTNAAFLAKELRTLGVSLQRILVIPDELDAIAEAVSQSERKAMSAERETVDRLIAMHLAERVGEEFKARISGVTRFGLFVKLLDTGADGFVPVGTLGKDYYKHVETHHALVGERTGESYRLGDRVDVRLVEASPAAGALRFEMLSDGRPSPALAKAGKKRGGKAARKAAKAPKRRAKQKE